MSRALNDVAAGTLFGVALNYKGLLDSRLPEFQQPPARRQPTAAPRADRPWRGDRRARHPGGFLALHRRRRKWPRAG
ncbi:TPA: hypothetical protein ACNV5A_004922, partial [Aeromonas hydrophila]